MSDAANSVRAFARARPPATRFARARLATWLGLFGIGAYTGLLGPALPELAAQAGLGVADAGAFFTPAFGAGIISTAVTGRALDRFGRRWPLLVGFLLDGVALLALPWVTSPLAFFAVAALLGLGDGAIVVGVHVVIAEANPEHETAALNLLNVFFGAGAVVAPVFAAAARALGADQLLLFVAFGVLQLAGGVVLLGAALPERHPEGGRAVVGRAILRQRFLWLLALLLLVYVGVEIGLGAWVFTYARAVAGLSGAAAALLTSAYWGALTLGRLLSPLALRRLTPVALLVTGAAVSTVGTLLLLLAGSLTPALVAGVVLAGLGFGPVWPVTFALAARAFPYAAGSATGALGTVAGAGGLGLPWVQGRILAGAGPAAGISVTAVSCVALTALALAIRRSPDLPR